MALVSFPFHAGYPVVDVEFVSAPTGVVARRRLLVDCGFTGRSAFVLPAADSRSLAQGWAAEGQTSGALSGRQNRMWVIFSVPAVRFRQMLLAIATDTRPLGLPPGVHGLAGLTFLQQFERWGGQRDAGGNWSFLLSTP